MCCCYDTQQDALFDFSFHVFQSCGGGGGWQRGGFTLKIFSFFVWFHIFNRNRFFYFCCKFYLPMTPPPPLLLLHHYPCLTSSFLHWKCAELRHHHWGFCAYLFFIWVSCALFFCFFPIHSPIFCCFSLQPVYVFVIWVNENWENEWKD